MLRRAQSYRANSGQLQRFIFVTGACALALVLGGCFGEKRPTAKVVNVSFAHPVMPVDAMNGAPDDPPQIPYLAEPLPPLGASHAAPPKPRVASPPQNESPSAAKPSETVILPELSPEEMAAAKTETQQSLDAALGNLARTSGKSLNASQKDLESKARSFMDSAREAIRNGDWPRAQNLAKKADVLSRELAASL
jgi:type IV secretory pathway VirB10-like protein